MKIQILVFILSCWSANLLHAQDNKVGTLTGDFETQNSFFIRDSIIGAANTPQYDRQKFGSNNWLTLNYNVMGFDIGIRFDAYYNSNLVDPLDSYSALGLGRWHIRKSIHGLDITAGYFYDQIGNGTIFRAYNERYLPIDNAVVGARLIYTINENWRAKVFAGQQKKVEKQINLFENYQPIIVGAAVDGFIKVNDDISLSPGVGAVRRTLDDATMNQIATDIGSYAPENVFVPKYTTYAVTAYNRLNYKKLAWYVEGSYKSEEAVNTNNTKGVLENKAGYNLFTSLGYSTKGFSVVAQYKYTDHFILRTSPLQTLNRGLVAYLPSMSKQNTYRLTARYNAATQEVGEQSTQLDLIYVPIQKKLTLNLNLSYIRSLQSYSDANIGFEQNLLYAEANFSANWKVNKTTKAVFGFQFQKYNQEVFEQKPGVPIVTSYVPYAELKMRFKKRRSLRVELQYMHNEQDYGSWAFALVEFNVKNWSFWASNMINVIPKKYDKIEMFYEFGTNYTQKSNKFELVYKRQVEGIVCTGGVCRYQPAFNGVQFNVVSSF